MNFAKVKTIAIPNGNATKITANGVTFWEKTSELLIVWIRRTTCSYTLGQSYNPTANNGYMITEIIPVTPSTTYTLKLDARTDSSFRVIGLDDNGNVTEVLPNQQITSFVSGENIWHFTTAYNTTQMVIRTYEGVQIDGWKLTY